MSERIELTNGSARCLILPKLGGSLGGWWIGEQAFLRPSDDVAIASVDPTQLSAFPLVPFSNRIGDARFEWEGRTIALQPNRTDEPNALHGFGWQRGWEAVEVHEATAMLRHEHLGDANWPWPLLAVQRIALGDRELVIELSATNLADEAVPLAVGYHPYFPRAGARLTLNAKRVWLADQHNLPASHQLPAGSLDLSHGPEIAVREIDNCYEGVYWPVRIEWPDRSLTIDCSASLPCAVVYANAAANALCVEPVAHVSNALNLSGEVTAVPLIAPGESFTARIVLSA